MPPPLPLQAVSEVTVLPTMFSVVPPTATTFGELEGQMTPDPLSPLEAKKVIPGLLKYES